MIKINEFMEEEITNTVEKIIAEKVKIAIEELSKVKPAEKEIESIKEVAHILSWTESGIKTRVRNGKMKLFYDQNNITMHIDDLEKCKKNHLYKMINRKP